MENVQHFLHNDGVGALGGFGGVEGVVGGREDFGVARERVPRQFLEKIVRELIHKGLVRSRRGPHGGYVLARPADQVTFRDVIEAVEGPISLNVCVGEHPDCFLLGACGMNRVWREGQRRVMDLFENTTIADVRRPPMPADAAPTPLLNTASAAPSNSRL